MWEKPSSRSTRLIVSSSTLTSKRVLAMRTRSTRRQRTTPSVSGSGPFSTISLISAFWATDSFGTRPGALPLCIEGSPTVKFENVGFAYDSSKAGTAARTILHNVSFEIPAGVGVNHRAMEPSGKMGPVVQASDGFRNGFSGRFRGRLYSPPRRTVSSCPICSMAGAPSRSTHTPQVLPSISLESSTYGVPSMRTSGW